MGEVKYMNVHVYMCVSLYMYMEIETTIHMHTCSGNLNIYFMHVCVVNDD